MREVADHLYRQGDLPAAREQMVEMLALEPDEPALRVRLKYLAELTNAPEAYRRGLWPPRAPPWMPMCGWPAGWRQRRSATTRCQMRAPSIARWWRTGQRNLPRCSRPCAS